MRLSRLHRNAPANAPGFSFFDGIIVQFSAIRTVYEDDPAVRFPFCGQLGG